MKIYIGGDHRQAIALNTLIHSLTWTSSVPLEITPLVLHQLPLKRVGLTPFTYSRFLVPYLCDFKGQAVFLDADILAVDDIAGILEDADATAAVCAVDTNPMFERAAVMVFNCAHPDNMQLTPQYIETAEKLHLLGWTSAVGWLPRKWNHLVGYDAPSDDVSLIHYTMGLPIHEQTKGCEHAEVWRSAHKQMNSTAPWEVLMGQSVHQPKPEWQESA